MDEIEICAIFDTTEQTVTRFWIDAVPAHVRERQTKVGHLWYVFFDDTQHIHAVTLFTATAKKLHAQANPQHGLGAGFDQVH
ncbi:hypothetical protein D3C78_1823930 [compost metagenome]